MLQDQSYADTWTLAGELSVATGNVLHTEAALLALGTRDRSCDAKADVAGDDGRPLAAKLEARDEASAAFLADTQRGGSEDDRGGQTCM